MIGPAATAKRQSKAVNTVWTATRRGMPAKPQNGRSPYMRIRCAAPDFDSANWIGINSSEQEPLRHETKPSASPSKLGPTASHGSILRRRACSTAFGSRAYVRLATLRRLHCHSGVDDEAAKHSRFRAWTTSRIIPHPYCLARFGCLLLFWLWFPNKKRDSSG